MPGDSPKYIAIIANQKLMGDLGDPRFEKMGAVRSTGGFWVAVLKRDPHGQDFSVQLFSLDTTLDRIAENSLLIILLISNKLFKTV